MITGKHLADTSFHFLTAFCVVTVVATCSLKNQDSMVKGFFVAREFAQCLFIDHIFTVAVKALVEALFGENRGFNQPLST